MFRIRLTLSTGPRWNFEKFLLDHRGQPVRRYDEAMDPLDIAPDIDMLLDPRFHPWLWWWQWWPRFANIIT